MMASLLAPAPANSPGGPGRISQLLPTVKCSSCNDPVPLAELGEHICAKPPPLPTTTQPSSSSQPLGQRRSNAPSPKPNSISLPSNAGPSRFAPPQSSQHRPTPSTSSDRSRKTSVSSLSPFPVSRPDGNDSGSTRREMHTPSVSSPLRERPPSGTSIHSRTRTISTASSASTPSTARPFSSARSTPSPTPTTRLPSPQPLNRQPSPQLTPTAQPKAPPFQEQPKPRQAPPVSFVEPRVDTKSGGEAGMAGVGRRGFAAVAHAAVFLAPTHDTIQARRENAPKVLDINAALKSA